MPKHASNIDLTLNQLLNFKIQNLASLPAAGNKGRMVFNTTDNELYVDNGTAFEKFYKSTVVLNNIAAPTGDLSLNSQKITNLAAPTTANDAANKNYVDNAVAGLTWKTAVRAATTANGTLSTAFANGQAIDGVTLATGDRILIKNQTTASENGIYTVNASGAPTRATDADSQAELLNAAVFVQQGTSNSDTGWTMTTNAPITVGTTALTWAQFTGGSFTGGNGIDVTGSVVSAKVDNTTVEFDGSGNIRLKAGGAGRKFVGTVSGDNTTTSFTITHNFNTKDVVVSVRGTSAPNTDEVVYPDIKPNNVNSVQIDFGIAPATGVNFNVTVIG